MQLTLLAFAYIFLAEPSGTHTYRTTAKFDPASGAFIWVGANSRSRGGGCLHQHRQNDPSRKAKKVMYFRHNGAERGNGTPPLS